MPDPSPLPKPQPGPPPELPLGFRAAGVACGIKSQPGALDLALIVADRPCAAAGVFTQNRVVGAPVQVNRTRLPASELRGVVINSGNANACTGPEGLEAARRMTSRVAERLGCRPEQVLVCSTGIIGQRLPMPRIEAGIAQAFDQLEASPAALERAARAIMTTDTVPKWSTRTRDWQGTTLRVVGIAKGAAMIAPRLATMISVVLTDACLTPTLAAEMLRGAADATFNCISVEGHTSTSDTVLLLSSGAAAPAEETAADAVGGMVAKVCTDLAQAIAGDAEGAAHRITIDVEGLPTQEEARRVARTIAESPLVKTAIYGADPNWGRIVSAAGYAGVAFAQEDLSLWLNDTLVFCDGLPVPFDAAKLSASLRDNFEAHVRLQFRLGDAGTRFWTCDLTEAYVRLNAEYHT